MSNSASTPTAPAPTPAPAATPAAAPAQPRSWTPAITISSPASSSTDQGASPEPPARDQTRDRTAKIVASQASRMAAREPDDADDDESQDDPKPEAARTPPGQAAQSGTPDTPAAAPEPSAREKNAARIREALKAQAAAREAEQARRAAQTQPAQPPATQQTNAQFWTQVRRHPDGVIAGMREAGLSVAEIKQIIEAEALAPGTSRAQSVAEELAEQQKADREQLQRLTQHVQAREQSEFITREQQHLHSLAATKEGEDSLYPHASRLSPERLYKLAERIVADKPPGSPMTYESLLLDIEDELESLLPPAPPSPSPANPPASTTTPAAKTKHTRAALPPDLAGESGKHQPKPRTERERSAAILARAKKRIEARARSAG